VFTPYGSPDTHSFKPSFVDGIHRSLLIVGRHLVEGFTRNILSYLERKEAKILKGRGKDRVVQVQRDTPDIDTVERDAA